MRGTRRSGDDEVSLVGTEPPAAVGKHESVVGKPGRPFLRWAGSKSQQVPLIASVCPEFAGTYVEPFAGSAALFFHLSPPRAALSDSNPDLVRALSAVKECPAGIVSALEELPLGREAYYEVRASMKGNLGELERAVRLIYLNRFCFNGLYRTNRSGHFNVPYGRPKTNSLPSRELLLDCSKRLEAAKIVCRDFREALASVRKGDLVYLDPPYALPHRRSFTSYSPKPFSLEDLEELSENLVEIDRVGAQFVLSFAATAYSTSLFRSWNQRRYLVRRNVAGFGDSRRRHFDLLVSNFEIPNLR